MFGVKENFPGGATPAHPNYSLNWSHRDAADYLPVLVAKYGQPSSIDPSPGGTIVWKKERLMNTCFDRIELRDESIAHCKPMDHRDFVYFSVNYDVSPSRYLEVSSLSGSVTYDKLKKLLTARCGSAEAAIATLALATHIGEGHVSLTYVQANEMYKQWILDTKNPGKVDQMYDLLCFNLKHQKGNPGSEGSWPLAFPEGCTEAGGCPV